MATKLKKLKINEVSGVSRGANQSAHILFWKNDETPYQGDNKMTLEEILEKLEKFEASNAELTVLAKMSDAEKAYLDGLDDDQKKKFMGASSEDREKMMSMKKAEDEKVEKTKEDVVSKSDFEAIQKANKELAQKVAKMESDKAFDVFKADITDQLPSLKSEQKASFVKSLFAMGKEDRDAIVSELKKAEKVVADYMVEKGTSVRGSDDPESQLDAMAKKYAEDNSVDFVKAYDAVTRTEEGQRLYAESLPN